MAGCGAQSFARFDAGCIAALRERARGEGADDASLAGEQTTGVVSRAGFEVRWSYALETQSLTVECTSSPFFVPCSVINGQIKSWIEGCYAKASA